MQVKALILISGGCVSFSALVLIFGSSFDDAQCVLVGTQHVWPSVCSLSLSDRYIYSR